jgi:uncharacterized protein YjdB
LNQDNGDVTCDLAIQAQMTAALNRRVINVTTPNVGQQDFSNAASYYLAAPCNFYSKFWHIPGISIDQLSYGFAYDDVFDKSSSLHTPTPTKVITVFGGYAGGDTQAPTPPGNLGSPSKTSTSVNLSWTSSTDNVVVTGYEVFVNAETSPRLSVTSTSATIGSLTSNTTYAFKVRAKDGAGNFSSYSNTLSVTTSPASTAQPVPGTIQAESYAAMNGVQKEPCGDVGGGENVGYIDPGDWMDYIIDVASAGAYTVGFRVASQPGNGQLQIRNSTGTSLATVNIAATGGWQSWATVNANVTLPAGVQTIRIHALAAGWNLNWMQFTSSSTVPVTSVSVSPATASIGIGATQQLTATVLPANATNKNVMWSTSNAGVAAVSNSGLVTGVAVGNATITVTTEDGSKVATSIITVTTGASANLALNKPATGLCTENASFPPGAAVDGNPNTRWSSCPSDPQWLAVDLGATYNISRVKITWETALGKDYQIQVSTNGSTWTSIRNVTGNTSVMNDLSGLSGSARHIRMYGTARGTAWGYSIFEFEVYGSAGPSNTPPTANAGADKTITLPTNNVLINGTGSDPDGSITAYAWTRVSGPNTPTLTNANTANLTASGMIAGTYIFRLTVTDNGGLTASDDVTVNVNAATATNIALNKVTTVSSTENGGTPGASAVDGNTGTRWSSVAADPQWIYVDLGGNYNVNRVKVTWETALGKDYLVQIATASGGPWTTMKTITANAVTVNDHTGLSGTGRYVRIYGTARGTQWGYSIWELEVYGSNAGGRMDTFVDKETNDENVQLYPNPTDGTVNVVGVRDGAEIIVRAMSGQTSFRSRLLNGHINISHLERGMYVLYVNDGGIVTRSKVFRK